MFSQNFAVPIRLGTSFRLPVCISDCRRWASIPSNIKSWKLRLREGKVCVTESTAIHTQISKLLLLVALSIISTPGCQILAGDFTLGIAEFAVWEHARVQPGKCLVLLHIRFDYAASYFETTWHWQITSNSTCNSHCAKKGLGKHANAAKRLMPEKSLRHFYFITHAGLKISVCQ